MLDIERPSDFGYEENKRNWSLFRAFQEKVHAFVYNDNEDFDTILKIFEKRDKKIKVVDLSKVRSVKEIQKAVGIKSDKYGYDGDSFRDEDYYLVFRHFDKFVIGHQDGLEHNGKTSQIYHLMRVAQKYSRGTMYVLDSDSRDPNGYKEIMKVCQKSYDLGELMGDHAVISIIP